MVPGTRMPLRVPGVFLRPGLRGRPRAGFLSPQDERGDET